MSSNHSKFYEVTVTKVVRANSKAEAVGIAQNKSRVNGNVLAIDTETVQIYAADVSGLVDA